MADISLSIGQSVTFKSLNTNDLNAYNGKIVAIMTSDQAVKYGDVIAYTNVVNNIQGSQLDYSILTYFLLKQYSFANQQETGLTLLFAKEWIDQSTFVVVSDYLTANVNIYGVTTDTIQDVLSVIRNQGYPAALIKISQMN